MSPPPPALCTSGPTVLLDAEHGGAEGSEVGHRVRGWDARCRAQGHKGSGPSFFSPQLSRKLPQTCSLDQLALDLLLSWAE